MIDLYPPAPVRTLTPSVAKPRVTGEPLVASDWWDESTKAIQWETVHYSLLAEAARALQFKVKRQKDGRVVFWTTAADLLLIVAYVQRRDMKEGNGFVTLNDGQKRAATPAPKYTFNAPLPDWDGLPMEGME